MRGVIPTDVSVMQETVLVCFNSNNLVLYGNGDWAPDQVLHISEELEKVCCVGTDSHSSFLVTDCDSKSVFVLDERGKLRHRIRAFRDGELVGCALIYKQFWLGYGGQTIDIMTLQ